MKNVYMNSQKPNRIRRSLILLTTVLMLVMLIAVPAAATSEPPPAGPPEIANFQGSYANGILSYSGEAIDGVMAVAIILSDSDGTVVKADSVGVNPDMTFAGDMEIVLAKADTYTVSAANYEGGTTTDVKFFYGTFSITYELGGGTNNPGNPATYNVEDEITLLDPTREGYTFDGWYKDSAFTEKITGWTAGTTGDVVLHAKWSIIVAGVHITGEIVDGAGSFGYNALILSLMTLLAGGLLLIRRRIIKTADVN